MSLCGFGGVRNHKTTVLARNSKQKSHGTKASGDRRGGGLSGRRSDLTRSRSDSGPFRGSESGPCSGLFELAFGSLTDSPPGRRRGAVAEFTPAIGDRFGFHRRLALGPGISVGHAQVTA
jgi:hypothetical protein